MTLAHPKPISTKTSLYYRRASMYLFVANKCNYRLHPLSVLQKGDLIIQQSLEDNLIGADLFIVRGMKGVDNSIDRFGI